MSQSNRLTLLAIAAIMFVAFIAHTLPTPRNVDDSFITFRYSRNIATGEGFVYNPGVRTLGTTTPLYAVTMAGIAFITRGDNFPWYALLTNAAAAAGSAALLFVLMRRATESIYPAVVVGLLWAVTPFSVTFAVSGMETSVVIFWMLAAFTALVYDRKWLVGLFAGLGLLTRPDAAIWILLLGLYQLIAEVVRHRRVPWQTWLAGALTIAPWVIFATLYFGSPIPNSLGAKSVAYHVADLGALRTLAVNYANPFQDYETIGSLPSAAGLFVYPALNLLAMSAAWRRERALLPLLVFPWLYFAIFAVANPLMFRWYFVPPLPAWIFGAVLGVWSLFALIAQRTETTRWLHPAAAALMLGWWGTLALGAWNPSPDHGPGSPAPEAAWHELELNYQIIGTQLRDEFGVTPETRVASADIGAVGYFSEATIVDTVGLVTPELSAYYPFDPAIRVTAPDEQNYAVPPQLILDTQPDYFVTMEGFVRNGLAQMPAFTDNYTLVREIPTEFYGTGMQLYARNDVLATVAAVD